MKDKKDLPSMATRLGPAAQCSQSCWEVPNDIFLNPGHFDLNKPTGVVSVEANLFFLALRFLPRITRFSNASGAQDLVFAAQSLPAECMRSYLCVQAVVE